MKDDGKDAGNLFSLAWRSFFLHTPDLMFIKDTNLVYQGASLSFARMVGLSDPAQVIGKTDFDLFTDQSLARQYVQDDRQLLETGIPLENHLERLPSDGEEPYWSSTSKYLIRDEAGQVIGLYGTGRDVTDQIRMRDETELRFALEEQYRIALKNTSVSIWEYDYKTKSILQSDRSIEKHGYDKIVPGVPQSLVEDGFVHPDSAQDFLNLYRSLEEGAKKADGVFRVKKADGSGYWYEHIFYDNVFGADGKPIRAIGMSKDVTAQFKEQESYQKELRFLMTLPENALGAAIVDATDWRLVKTKLPKAGQKNLPSCPTLEEYLEAVAHSVVEDEEVRGFFTRFSPDFVQEKYGHGQRRLTLEFLRELPDGTRRWVRDEIRFLTDPNTQHLMVVFMLTDVEDEKRREQELTFAAQRDAMTGLYNHDFTLKYIEQALREPPSEKNNALFMIDIDNFKQVNDTFGHLKGDEAIVTIASTIEHTFRATDIVGRVGGDEFLVLMKQVADPRLVHKKAKELIEALQYIFSVGQITLQLSCSVGISLSRGDNLPLQALQNEADAALYRAKKAGKNQYAVAGQEDCGGHINPLAPIDRSSSIPLRTLLEHMEGGVILFEVTKEILVTYASPSFFKTMGRDPEEIDDHGENFFSIVLPEDLPALKEAIFDASTGKILDHTYRVRGSDSGLQWRHILGSLLEGDPPHIHQIVGVITDISALKKQEEALRMSQERYRVALRLAGATVWEIDIPARRMTQPLSMAQRYGHSELVLENLPASIFAYRLLDAGSVVPCQEFFDKIFRGEESGSVLLRERMADGAFAWTRYRFAMLYDDNKNPLRAIGTMEPISQGEAEKWQPEQ